MSTISVMSTTSAPVDTHEFSAHLGGFLMGLLVGTFFYPVISTTKRHKLVMYGFRIAALPLVIILYAVLIRNFYTSDPYAGECVNRYRDPSTDTCCSVLWMPIFVMYSNLCKQPLQRVRFILNDDQCGVPDLTFRTGITTTTTTGSTSLRMLLL